MAVQRTKNRGGRPQKNSAERRDVRCSAAFTTHEARGVKMKAEACGKTISEFIRSTCLGAKMSKKQPMPNDNQRKAWVRIGDIVGKIDEMISEYTSGVCNEYYGECMESIRNELIAVRKHLVRRD